VAHSACSAAPPTGSDDRLVGFVAQARMTEGQEAVERPRKVRLQLAVPASDILARSNDPVAPSGRKGSSFTGSAGGKARRGLVGEQRRF